MEKQRKVRLYKLLVGLALLLVAIVPAACAPANADDQAAAVELGALVVIYSREGGFAGLEQEWIIHPDGSIDGPGEQDLVASEEELAAFVDASAAADMESLTALQVTPDACCDQFTYTLTYVAGDRSWSLVMTDSSENTAEVRELFELADELVTTADPAP